MLWLVKPSLFPQMGRSEDELCVIYRLLSMHMVRAMADWFILLECAFESLVDQLVTGQSLQPDPGRDSSTCKSFYRALKTLIAARALHLHDMSAQTSSGSCTISRTRSHASILNANSYQDAFAWAKMDTELLCNGKCLETLVFLKA